MPTKSQSFKLVKKRIITFLLLLPHFLYIITIGILIGIILLSSLHMLPLNNLALILNCNLLLERI